MRTEDTELEARLHREILGDYLEGTENLIANKHSLSRPQWGRLCALASSELENAIAIAWDKDSGAFEETSMLLRIKS